MPECIDYELKLKNRAHIILIQKEMTNFGGSVSSNVSLVHESLLKEETNSSVPDNMEIRNFDFPNVKEEFPRVSCENIDVSTVIVKEEMLLEGSSEPYDRNANTKEIDPGIGREDGEEGLNDCVSPFCFVGIKMEKPDNYEGELSCSETKHFSSEYAGNCERECLLGVEGLEENLHFKLSNPCCIDIKMEKSEDIDNCESDFHTNNGTPVTKDENSELDSCSTVHRCDQGHASNELIRGIECQKFPILCIDPKDKVVEQFATEINNPDVPPSASLEAERRRNYRRKGGGNELAEKRARNAERMREYRKRKREEAGNSLAERARNAECVKEYRKRKEEDVDVAGAPKREDIVPDGKHNAVPEAGRATTRRNTSTERVRAFRLRQRMMQLQLMQESSGQSLVTDTVQADVDDVTSIKYQHFLTKAEHVPTGSNAGTGRVNAFQQRKRMIEQMQMNRGESLVTETIPINVDGTIDKCYQHCIVKTGQALRRRKTSTERVKAFRQRQRMMHITQKDSGQSLVTETMQTNVDGTIDKCYQHLVAGTVQALRRRKTSTERVKAFRQRQRMMHLMQKDSGQSLVTETIQTNVDEINDKRYLPLIIEARQNTIQAKRNTKTERLKEFPQRMMQEMQDSGQSFITETMQTNVDGTIDKCYQHLVARTVQATRRRKTSTEKVKAFRQRQKMMHITQRDSGQSLVTETILTCIDGINNNDYKNFVVEGVEAT